MPASPGRASRARPPDPASRPRRRPTGARGTTAAATLSRAPTRRRRARGLIAVAALAAAIAVLTLLLGGQVYWLCVPAALLATSECRTRAGAAWVTMAVVAASVAASLGRTGQPPIAIALLVPAASVAVLLVVRERLEGEREAMRRSALTDPLTGLANRRSLLSRMDYEILRHTRVRHPFGVVMLDLDGFKGLNDRFGHAAGDDLLIDVAAAVLRAIRDQDTAARMGGDEFCVLAPETDLAGTQQLAERVLDAVSSVTAGIEAMGASAGVAAFPADSTVAGDLLDAADQRLLESKRRRGRMPRRRAA